MFCGKFSGESRSEVVAHSLAVPCTPGDYEILLMAGPDAARLISLTERKQTLGRSPTCGIRIDDPNLEPHHLVVTGPLPETDLQHLGGTAEIQGTQFRVGSTVCLVQPAIVPGLFDRPSLASKPFHRSPQIAFDDPEPPKEPQLASRPLTSGTPPWGPILGGATTGLIVTAVTGQWLFGVFSLVTAGIAGVTWLIQRRGHRRALRRWLTATDRAREKFDHQCLEYAQHLATKRRNRHRYIGELFMAADSGDEVLWAKRQIGDVCIGFGSRQVVVVPGAQPLAFNDIPVTVDLSPGSVIGIFGARSHLVGTAILLRLALEVGPSDWRLVCAGELSATWSHLRSLPHLRSSSLARDDLNEMRSDSLHSIVLVTDAQHLAHRHSLPLRYMESHQASLIVCAASQRELPAFCTDVIDSSNAELDGVGSEGSQNIVTALRQWHDPDAHSLAVPDRVHLDDLLETPTLGPQEIRQFWSSKSTTLHVDLGLSSEGPVSCDVAIDGPHVIVVGTTGSGKSELLRSLVVSMALYSSPSYLNFILFDYKGGSAFDACRKLPHVVAVVTDLDRDDGNQKMAARVVRGLEAELRRRETVLRTVGMSDQDEYQRRLGPNDDPMPRLVIVVDELAALRSDVPEVIPALISVAQRGRSLGLHLVLATQRPGTELTPDVMANAAIRLALRLQTREDSMQVIGHPSAAGLPRNSPGRALVSFGSDAPEEFQSLYVSDKLNELVMMADVVAREMGLDHVRRPWCDPLRAHLRPTPDRERFSIGLVDDPDRQQQLPLLWEPDNHLLLMAGAGSGKTWSLYALAAISQRDEPDAQLFFISGRGDSSSDSGWVSVSDRERLHRLLTYLVGRIKSQQSKPHCDQRVTVLVDDVDLWRSQYTDDRVGLWLWDMFERVVVEGPSAGMHCVVSATQDQALPPVMKSRIGQRWMPGSRAGSFMVQVPGVLNLLPAQIFDPRACIPDLEYPHDLKQIVEITDPKMKQLLTVLPTDITRGRDAARGSYGKHADTMSEAIIRTDQVMRCVIFGHRASGRTTALAALTAAWRELHPDGLVISSECQILPSELFASEDFGLSEKAVLIVIDDADRRLLPPSLMSIVMKALRVDSSPDGESWKRVSVVAAAAPHGLRSQPDHWLHLLRRYRSGILLGRCADEDGDLLGQYSRILECVPRAISRGLWVEDGESQGILQFYRRSSSEDDCDQSD